MTTSVLELYLLKEICDVTRQIIRLEDERAKLQRRLDAMKKEPSK